MKTPPNLPNAVTHAGSSRFVPGNRVFRSFGDATIGKRRSRSDGSASAVPAPGRGRNTELSLERSVERSLGLVADVLGDLS